MGELSHLSCWALSANNAGMTNQAVGLAEALGLNYQLHHTRQDVWWRFLPPALWPAPLAMKEGGGSFTAPWPNVVISSGRRSVATAMAIGQASGGKTFTIHIQRPQAPLHHFDLVIVPQHDGLSGANVITTRGSLHRISSKRLAAARTTPRFAHMKRPLIAVLVGGATKRAEIPAQTWRNFAATLGAAILTSGGSMVMTPSRRTGKENEAILRNALPDAWIWDGTGENPYFNMLAEADAILVTGDSASMVSEASATGKPVYIYELYHDPKFQPMLAELQKAGIARPFTGTIESWNYTPVDETAEVAARIRPLLLAHRLRS
jgi:mitochondrial fission protein ELM1